jgi:hypothetical protein
MNLSCFDFIQHFGKTKMYSTGDYQCHRSSCTRNGCYSHIFIRIRALEVNATPTSLSAAIFNFVMASLTMMLSFLLQFTSARLYVVPLASVPTHTLLLTTTRGRITRCIGHSIIAGKALALAKQSAHWPFFSTSLPADKPPKSSHLEMIPEISVGGDTSAGVCLLSIASKNSISDFIFLLTASWIL